MNRATIALVVTAITGMTTGTAFGWFLRGWSGNRVAYPSDGVGSAISSATAQPPSSPPRSPGTDAAARVLEDYLAATTCADRLALTTNPDGNRQALLERTKQICRPQKYESIDTSGCKAPEDDGYCYAEVVWSRGKNAYGVEVADSRTYCLAQTPTGFKIDWRCSIGYSPITVPAFRAQHLIKQPAIFRMYAKLGDYYNYEYREARETNYSIALRDKESESIYAFVLRRSPDGQRLFDRLKDGKEHAVLIEIVYLPGSEDSSVAAVNRLLGFGWREEPAEHAAPSPSSSAVQR